jgi:hypothetical protein
MTFHAKRNCCLPAPRVALMTAAMGISPWGGHRFSPLTATGSPRPWPSVLPTIVS